MVNTRRRLLELVKVKIALCFSGQPRALYDGYEYFNRNLLSLYDVDVFVHSWNSEFNDAVVDLYKPKLFLFEDPAFYNVNDKWTDPKKLYEGWSPRSVTSMWYSIKQSNELKVRYEIENDFVYDWAIRARFDYALNVVLPFYTLDNSKIFLPERETDFRHQHACDQFACGNSYIMNLYSKVFDNLDEYFERTWAYVGETVLTEHLKKFKLLANNMEPLDMDWPFSKSDGRSRAHGAIIMNDRDYWTSK